MKIITVLLLAVSVIACNVVPSVLKGKPDAEPDCSFNVYPYTLKQNKSGEWAILQGELLLGYSTRYGKYDFYYYDAWEVYKFSDSCSAKGMLKQYLEYLDKNSFK